MLKVAILGFGFMGRMHYRCWKQRPDVQVVAICDASPQAFDDSAKNRGNLSGAEGDVDLAGVTIYRDPEQLYGHEQFDAVSITVPSYLHASCTLRAFEAGVHVLCEKPMALNLSDGTRMIEAARHYGRILQIGHCTRFWPEYAKAREIVNSGVYGRVIAATFQRLSATAARKAGSWFTQEEQSGGVAFDLHIHDTDFVQYLFGMPRAVSSCGATGPEGNLRHMITRYDYGDKRLIVAEGGWAMMPAFGFVMRFHIALERATLVFDHQAKPTLRICPAEGEVIVPELVQGDGYSEQIAHFARRVLNESVAPVITPEDAWNSIRIIEAERESVRSGRPVCVSGLPTPNEPEKTP